MANMLPNAARAEVDIRKLRDYCLNLEHDEGKHKSVFLNKYDKECQECR
jgi:hypothetical protein